MKIIKEGRLDFHKAYEFTCHKCGCVFQVEFGEYDVCSDGKNDLIRRTYCPTCGKLLYNGKAVDK